MNEVWDFIKLTLSVAHNILSAVSLLVLPLLVVGVWRLNRRLDVFVRVETIAKKAKANPEAVWTPKEYRDAMAEHERAVQRKAAEDRQKMNHPPEGRQAR